MGATPLAKNQKKSGVPKVCWVFVYEQRCNPILLALLSHTIDGTTVPRYSCTRFWQLRAARAARGAPADGSAGVAGAHKFTEGDYFLFPFRRVSRLRRPFVLRPRRRAGRAEGLRVRPPATPGLELS